jgi:hypothetical protein
MCLSCNRDGRTEASEREIERLRALEVIVMPEQWDEEIQLWAREILMRTEGGRQQLQRMKDLHGKAGR